MRCLMKENIIIRQKVVHFCALRSLWAHILIYLLASLFICALTLPLQRLNTEKQINLCHSFTTKSLTTLCDEQSRAAKLQNWCLCIDLMFINKWYSVLMAMMPISALMLLYSALNTALNTVLNTDAEPNRQTSEHVPIKTACILILVFCVSQSKRKKVRH